MMVIFGKLNSSLQIGPHLQALGVCLAGRSLMQQAKELISYTPEHAML